MLKSKILLLLVLAACFFAACKTDPAYDRVAQLAIDDDIIRKQLTANGTLSGFTKTGDGLYYFISKAGEGRAPVDTDMVGIHFVGRLFLNQQVIFDSTFSNTDTTKFLLSDGIEGWEKGIPLIKPGGRIRLIVPSTLAYQNQEIRQTGLTDTTLAKNSILDFDIQLLKIIPPVTTTVTTN
ncbi:FKBP-type peptidyl-prolyl cis-trans isomerase [Pedobacter hartonius]|nr:FKBP-type peptidyl-prolyl cis-trans isomerase [Pedobacter hartonius]